jgi:hypothetical protein
MACSSRLRELKIRELACLNWSTVHTLGSIGDPAATGKGHG